MKYPDISHWHPVNDWEAAKKNCGFLISKATQGTYMIDDTLDSFIKGCEEHGIPYWLFTFLDYSQELEQAKYLVEVCKNKIGKYFVGYILDVERDNDATNVKEALDYINSLGVKTMIYTGYSDYKQYKELIESRPAHCAWWEARYGLNTGIYNDKYPCHDGVDLHQFTSRGSCDGISGNCDLNRILQKGKEWYKTPLSTKREEVTNGKYASKVVKQAQAWLGKNELDGTHKEIIDVYNSHKPLARGYKVKYTDNWCATFVTAVAVKLGYTSIIPKECGCQKMIDLFKIMGCWIEDENRTPNPGDIVFYDWQDDGKGNNTGWADHVGIVEKVSGGIITVIEGNYDGNDADKVDGVERRLLEVNGKYIRGYGVPRYDAEIAAEEEVKPTTIIKANKAAKAFQKSLAGTYKVTANWLNVRHGAGITNASMVTIPMNTEVKCFGYYTTALGKKWLYVQFVYKGVTYVGFASSAHLKK